MVGYVHSKDVDARFMQSLIKLQDREPRLATIVGRYSGPAVALMRNLIVVYFLYETECDYLLMVDTDMVFEPSDVALLLKSANPDTKPVVGGLCFAEGNYGGPMVPTLYQGEDMNDIAHDYQRDRMYRVAGTGAAFLLIHRKALMAFDREAPMPWFNDEIHNGLAVSEDKVFCRRLRSLGIPLWVHTGARIGHVKSRVLTEALYLKERAEEKAIDRSLAP